jgi:hypothetical protein
MATNDGRLGYAIPLSEPKGLVRQGAIPTGPNEVDGIYSGIPDLAGFFAGRQIQDLLEQANGVLALAAPNPEKPWMLSWCPEAYFLGAFNHLGRQDRHAHSLAEELYINEGPGALRIHCWYAGAYKPYDLFDPGSVLLIPRGVVHLAEFLKPGWGLAVRGPHIFDEKARKQVK